MVYNKEPILVLWDIVKTLTTIPAYKQVMDEDEDSIPTSYLLLRSEISDTTKTFGDGSTQIRHADCDIILVSKGTQPNSTDLHNVNKALVDVRLKTLGIAYTGINNGYDSSSLTTEYTWTFTINYIK
jgi:zona occludens toxin (predicted ATPase)